jgi:hypothetical protein
LKIERTELRGIRITSPVNSKRAAWLLTKGPSLTPAPIFRSANPWYTLLEGPLPIARIERRESSAAEDEENEGYEDCAEHADGCAYLEWLKQNKKQREFISKQILIMLDQVHREQDPEELALLLGKIACFESELDVLQKRWWDVREADSDYGIPRDMAQNTFEEELCDFHSGRTRFKKYDDYVSPYMFYTQALHEIKARMQPPDPVWTGPDHRKKPSEGARPRSIKKRSVRAIPTVKKAPSKSRDKHGSISIVVRY